MQNQIESRVAQVSHRDHPLRALQNYAEGYLPEIIALLHKSGLLHGTRIAEVIKSGRELHPDDITLSGIELTVEAAKTLVISGMNIQPFSRLILGGVLDVVDGAWARRLKLASVDGAIKDVLADRTSESYMAGLIAQNRALYDGCPPDLDTQLRVAFQLSTLTKAACEMTGVRTSEGGQGSMLERRRVLLWVLLNLGLLNRRTIMECLLLELKRGWQIVNQNTTQDERLLQTVDSYTASLISSSHSKAQERVVTMASAATFQVNGWHNPALADPNSSAAVEARKYAAVVLLNERMGLQIVDHLNALVEEVEFPSAQLLMARYPYIAESVHNTGDFLRRAVGITARE